MKPTIYDVAEKVGVSIATVSKVINNTGRISEKTRKKVLLAMEEIQYQPSVVASALTGKHTNTIGLLIPDIANAFFAELARSVEDRGHELGFSVVMCNTDNEPKKEAQYLKWLQQKSVDGIILGTGIQNESTLNQLIEQKIPTALIARDIPSLAVDTVVVDDFTGGYQATSHLIGLGHTEIAFIVSDLTNLSEEERYRGYLHALQEAGIAPKEEYKFINNSTIEDAKQAMQNILKRKERPTAVFALNDLLAIGTIQGAKACGLKVPDDLSVVGFDDTVLATINEPPLTTIAQPIHDMGRQVIDLLSQEIKGKKKGKRRVVVSSKLVIRKSTASLGKGLR
jgi:DNA-binding LacI/PurR family transcriptional regulator